MLRRPSRIRARRSRRSPHRTPASPSTNYYREGPRDGPLTLPSSREGPRDGPLTLPSARKRPGKAGALLDDRPRSSRGGDNHDELAARRRRAQAREVRDGGRAHDLLELLGQLARDDDLGVAEDLRDRLEGGHDAVR